MRRRLSYANVISTLALVFAMSGGALAANHYLINSTKQIDPKVLKKLKGKTGKSGATGANGATGAIGAAGAAGTAGAPGKAGTPGKDGGPGAIGPSTAFNTNSGEDILAFPAVSDQELTVSSLSLPAGNFSVLGKVDVNNNAASTVQARCELILGTTTIDAGFDGIFLGETPSDREFIALSGTGTLASPATAKIVCKVTSTSGNYLDRSITAIQVGSLG